MLAIASSIFLNAVYHDIWLCCASVPVLVAGALTSISLHTKCIGNIWHIFPKLPEVICLPFLTPGVPRMACYLEFPVFQRQAIVAWSIENTDFVIFLLLNDFLNVGNSYLSTFFFKVLVAFFWCMDGLYITLIIKARRIRIEPCRLDDAFDEQKLFPTNHWWNPGQCASHRSSSESNLALKSSGSIASTIPYSWKLATLHPEIFFIIFDEESFLSAIFRAIFSRRSASFDSSRFMKWHTHISLRKPGIIVFNPVKIADYKSTPMKLIFFRFGFADRISNQNLPNVFSSLVKCSPIGPSWTGVPPSMVFRKYW